MDISLFQSCCQGELEAVRIALCNGASTSWRNSQGFSPLLAAARNGHTDICGLLLKHGSNVNETHSISKSTALHFAAQYGHDEIVTILLNHGANIKIVTEDKLTALDFAKRNNHEQIIKYLTSLDFRINDTSK